MPYKDADFTTKSTDAMRKIAGEWEGQIKRIWYVPRETNLKVLKVFLSRGRPVVVSMYVHKDFEEFKAPSRDKAVYSSPQEQTVDHKKEGGTRCVCSGSTTSARAGASCS